MPYATNSDALSAIMRLSWPLAETLALTMTPSSDSSNFGSSPDSVTMLDNSHCSDWLSQSRALFSPAFLSGPLVLSVDSCP